MRSTRQLTVLFCDLIGSTRLSGDLDPEDWRELVLAYQAAAGEQIDLHDGHIAQYQGDGLLVYFGYPNLHEDDAVRAVRTGLGIIGAVRRLGRRFRLQDALAVRVGVHTGSVVTGELGHGEETELALGQTPSIAAGIQHLAAANGLVVSGATRRHLDQGPWAFDALGGCAIETFHEPIEIFALRSSGAESRAGRPAPPPAAEADDAERRQLTVMFLNLVGVKTLLERVVLEQLHDVLRLYLNTCSEVIERYGGHVAQYLDDGLLIYFGYPRAHEDSPRRSILAALELLEAVAWLNRRRDSGEVRLDVRIGIHTGPVVAGTVGTRARHEQLAVGQTPNVAARIMAQAEPGTVTLSAATHALVRGFFESRSLGARSLRGVEKPVELFRVLGRCNLGTSFEAAVSRGLSPLFGRELELARLLERFSAVDSAGGQVVLLSAAAGIGKSRLVESFRQRLASRPCGWTTWQCIDYEKVSPLAPVIETLRRDLELRHGDTPQAKLEQLERGLAALGIETDRAVPLLASLLDIPLGGAWDALTLAPKRQKELIFTLVVDILRRRAADRRLVLVVEDLHWADPSTLELLSHLIERSPGLDLLVLLTHRPGFEPPWTAENVTSLALGHLRPEESRSLIRHVAGGRELPAELIERLLATAEGIPLFVEELTKVILESTSLVAVGGRYELEGPLADINIPPTLQDSLMARLDRLSTAKEVAQIGAVIGREFSLEMLQAIVDRSEAELRRELDHLVAAELLTRRRLRQSVTYMFHHALVQETAYRSLLRKTRRRYHGRIAQTLEARFPDLAATRPELVARHFTEAGLAEPAIGYWYRAGRGAIRRSANVEAIVHLKHGLELLEPLQQTPENLRRRLDFVVALGGPELATYGYAAPEVGATFEQARRLCEKVGEPAQLFDVLQGLASFYLVRCDQETVLEINRKMLDLALGLREPNRLLEARTRVGISQYVRGCGLSQARECLELDLAGPGGDEAGEDSTGKYLFGHDPMVVRLCHLAVVLWLLGRPDEALRRCRAALERAQALSHPFSLSWSLLYNSVVHSLRGEVGEARERAAALAALSEEQGFAYRLAQARILEGWAQVHEGAGGDALRAIARAIDAVQATGALAYAPFFLSLLADAALRVGDVERGVATVAAAHAIVQRSRETFFSAELMRLEGELLLARSPDLAADAEQRFRDSLGLAEHQEAAALALRSASSLARLERDHGRPRGGWELLRKVRASITEGPDTADARGADLLLGHLRPQPRRPS